MSLIKHFIINGDCLEIMSKLKENSIDMVITSPPYDNLRTYDGYKFNFESTARELWRIIKPGSVVVWIVSDATINKSETGTSFKQALFFMNIGFNLHDTMIWNKGEFSAVGALRTRYAPVFEYMFIFSKSYVKTFNPIKDRINLSYGRVKSGTIRQVNGTTCPQSSLGKPIAKYGQRHNIWAINSEKRRNLGGHPAPFPENLVKDHILTWSNPNDIILDPFLGSGTSSVACHYLGRNSIGLEISSEYW